MAQLISAWASIVQWGVDLSPISAHCYLYSCDSRHLLELLQKSTRFPNDPGFPEASNIVPGQYIASSILQMTMIYWTFTGEFKVSLMIEMFWGLSTLDYIGIKIEP